MQLIIMMMIAIRKMDQSHYHIFEQYHSNIVYRCRTRGTIFQYQKYYFFNLQNISSEII